MRLLGILGLLAVAGACGAPGQQATTSPPAGASIGKYVALGDSLTAGFQSGGLTAAGQRAAYPVLLASRAQRPMHAPEGKDPGCPPPMGAASTADSCVRVNPGVETGNFAVPGARVEDLTRRTAANAGGAGPLYSLILGPSDTQVSGALKARPDFISVWIGANNVLPAALNGNPALATPLNEFRDHYAELLDALAPSGARVLLMTVPDVTAVPALVPAARLAQLGVGDASCAGSANRVSASRVVQAYAAGVKVSCSHPEALTPSEAETVRNTVSAYNAVITQLGAARGMKVFDVGFLVARLDSHDLDPMRFAAPFGADYSQDGVHPSSVAHGKLAAALVAFVNATFGTNIPTN